MTSEKAIEVLIKNRMIGSFELADAIDFAIKSLEEIDILKKDLKGRQKKIEKLISSDVRHTCEAEHFKDLYLIECKKNCALFLRYKDVNKELALLKNSKEESEVEE